MQTQTENSPRRLFDVPLLSRPLFPYCCIHFGVLYARRPQYFSGFRFGRAPRDVRTNFPQHYRLDVGTANGSGVND